MGIFSRLTDIVNANINSLLDHAEDPEKMVKLMIQEMEDTLVEVRTAAVRTITEKKEIQRRLEQLAAAEADWAEKAEFAISKGRDDLAKGALLAKRKLSETAKQMQGEQKAVEEALARHDEDLARLQSKLAEAKAKEKALTIRMATAKKRVQMRQSYADGRSMTRWRVSRRCTSGSTSSRARPKSSIWARPARSKRSSPPWRRKAVSTPSWMP